MGTTSTVGLSLRDVEDLVHVRLRYQLSHLAGQTGQQDRVAGHQSQTRSLHIAETILPHLKYALQFSFLRKNIAKIAKLPYLKSELKKMSFEREGRGGREEGRKEG